MIDSTGLMIINNIAGQNFVLDKFFIFITHFGIPIILLLIIFSWKKRILVQSVISIVASIIIDMIINVLFFRARPEQAVILVSASGSSFPSTHTFLAFALATILFLHKKDFGVYALFIAGFVGLSRIYLGVHYPSDVLGGIVLGIFVALIVRKVFNQPAFSG